jgi:beta-lactamase regulating signal transducer with metallopeptidase domain
MDPSVGLQAASGLVNFLLKTTVEWSVCLLLVRIAGSPRSRFNLWLTMLLGFLAQWIWMWAGVLRAAFPGISHAGVGLAGTTAARGERVAVATAMAGTLSRVVAGLLVCYVAVVAWRMMGTLAARVRLARAMRHKSAPEERVAAAFQDSVDQAEARGCELWVLPGLASPATLGWLRPQVIVPPACLTQDPAELKAVFWHELKHVERRDALWNAMVRACRNLLWFHPCVHHAVAALSAQRELACDAAVVREHPHSRDVYASCLVRFARMVDLAPESAIPTIEMASSAVLLTTRVHSILNDAPKSSSLSRAWRVTANMLLVGLMAATIPGLNILFATEQRTPAMQFPVAGAALLAMKGTALKSTNGRALTVAALQPGSGAVASGVSSIGLQHDEGLAAEHQAAMGVLTESTGMDAPTAGSDGRVSGDVTGSSRHGTAGQSSPSWTTVAVDAAERMGPLAGDRDDRH